MTASGIYLIRHKESAKKYIGRSIDIENRWSLHRRHTEQKRDRSPLHRAMRKYGYDAFDWLVLVKAPARLHVVLEHQFMTDWNTLVPAGYNVGGAAGGQPPRELLALMGPEERAAKEQEMRHFAQKMHATIRRKRQDPEYEANYRAVKSAAAARCWADRKAREAVDPVFAAEMGARRRRRAAKARATFLGRRQAKINGDAN
jgi:group I intron endonuclease